MTYYVSSGTLNLNPTLLTVHDAVQNSDLQYTSEIHTQPGIDI